MAGRSTLLPLLGAGVGVGVGWPPPLLVGIGVGVAMVPLWLYWAYCSAVSTEKQSPRIQTIWISLFFRSGLMVAILYQVTLFTTLVSRISQTWLIGRSKAILSSGATRVWAVSLMTMP